MVDTHTSVCVEETFKQYMLLPSVFFSALKVTSRFLMTFTKNMVDLLSTLL